MAHPATNIKSQSKQNTTNEQSCYNDFKQKYLLQMKIFSDERRSQMIRPWDRDWIDQVISEIKEQEESLNTGNVLPKKKYWHSYQVVSAPSGGDTLIMLNRQKQPVEVLAYEDIFDVLLDAHMVTDHGNRADMWNVTKHHYSIPLICFTNFQSLCNVCKAAKKKDQPEHVAFVDVVDFTISSDGDFNYVLIYLNKATGFCVLRPLMNANLATVREAALELLNTFLEFGPPVMLTAYVHRLEYFSSVLESVKLLCPDLNLGIVIQPSTVETTNLVICVLRALQVWMTETGSTNWATVCHVLQLKLNSTKRNPYSVASPLDMLFGKHDDTAIPRHVESTEKRNRDLQKQISKAVHEQQRMASEKDILKQNDTRTKERSLQETQSQESSAEDTLFGEPLTENIKEEPMFEDIPIDIKEELVYNIKEELMIDECDLDELVNKESLSDDNINQPSTSFSRPETST